MMQRIVASLVLVATLAIAVAAPTVHAQQTPAPTQATLPPVASTQPAPPLPQPLRPSPNALPAIQAPAIVAQDNSCASVCQSQHDQCRVQTKGSPSCDAARQRCLQTCLASKKSKP